MNWCILCPLGPFSLARSHITLHHVTVINIPWAEHTYTNAHMPTFWKSNFKSKVTYCTLLIKRHVYFYYIKLKSRLSVRLSVLIFWHADTSVMSALIEMGLTQNESCVIEEDQVYFNKLTEPNIHRQECVKDDFVSSH